MDESLLTGLPHAARKGYKRDTELQVLMYKARYAYNMMSNVPKACIMAQGYPKYLPK